jgi:ketosteroid isomerase-like protein
MVGPNEELVRRACEVINRSESVDAVMAGLEEQMHPDIELVNPEDAIEGGTRKGFAGMRTAVENFFAGAGRAATVELEQVYERGNSVLARYRIHARGSSSGAEAVSPPLGLVFTIRDGQVVKMEWRYWTAEILDDFERGAITASDQA